MASLLAVLLAIPAAVLICLGSLLVLAAPGDGQTGIIVLPMWLAGAALGFIALVLCWDDAALEEARLMVMFFAVIALASVAGSFVFCSS